MKKLTDRQLRIVKWLQGVKPKTTDEIAERFLICTRTVRNYISELQQHGLVDVRGRKGRQLTFTSIKKEKKHASIRAHAPRNQSSNEGSAGGDDPLPMHR